MPWGALGVGERSTVRPGAAAWYRDAAFGKPGRFRQNRGMTTPDPQTGPTAPQPAGETTAPDRVFRSSAGIAGGVLVLAIVAWLGVDALIRGEGRTPWVALAGMLLVVPLVLAFTLRPAVYANDHRLRVRNPFRTIVLPWAAVSGLRSGYTNEVFDQSGTKYQLWAIPVSLRARKKAGRERVRAATLPKRAAAPDVRGTVRPGREDPTRAPADRTMDDLRELCEARSPSPEAGGEPEVRWAYEVAAPSVAGLILLVILLAV